MYDVIVVGGGHVGLYTAGRLSQRGYNVLLLDQKDGIGKQIVCTGIISPEAFEQFDLPRETILSQINSVRFISPSGSALRYSHPAILAYVVDRGQFNKRLAELATQQGTEIRLGRQVADINQTADQVQLTLIRKIDASSETVSARLLIMATGVSYKLNRLAGLETPKDFLNGAQIHLDIRHCGETVVYLGKKIAPGAFAWVVPLQGYRARIGLLSEGDPTPFLSRLLDQIVPDWRDQMGQGSFDLRPVAQRALRKSTANRVVAVGEAAGQIKATTGGGIYYGLLGADAAVTTVEKAFQRQRFDQKMLSDYDRLWKQRIGDEIEVGYYCRKLFAKFTDAQIEELFEIAQFNGISSLAHREAEFDWHKRLLLSVLKIPRIRRLIGLGSVNLTSLTAPDDTLIKS